MNIGAVDLAGVVVATPAGRLDLVSYAVLRDTLIKLAAAEPRALVVRLGPDFEVPSPAMLAVFTTAWMKISHWPDIPLVLLAETSEHRDQLGTSGVARFVRTTASLEDALAVVEQPLRRRFRRIPLPNSPTAPIMARAVVREACELWNLPGIVDDAVLVVSELVENAVQHARTESVLKIELRSSGLSLAVRDEDPTPPVLGPPRPDAPGHQGVRLVDRISVAWGCTPSSDGGKIVWAVLRLPGSE